MKLEKRSEGGPVEPEEPTGPKGKKPVVVYIMILFIAAFLLMAWSFASHQRSNTEALGKLQSSVTAMREVQDLQDQVIALQKELADAEKRVKELEEQSAAQQNALESQERQREAMVRLYRLQQQYSAGDYAACRQILNEMESQGLADHFPRLSDGSVTRPEDRYQQLKEAVEARLAEAAAQAETPEDAEQ